MFMWNLRKKSVGLDITDRAVEAVELVRIGKRFIIKSKGRQELSEGIVEKGRIKNEKELVKAIKKVFNQARPVPIVNRKIVFGLPQNYVFTYILTIKSGKRRLTKRELGELVENELKKEFGDTDNLFFSFRLLNQSRTVAEILLLAADKKIISDWRDFFQKLKIEVEAFDIKTLAYYRSLFVRPLETAVLLIDIGQSFSYVNVFNRQGLCYSRSVEVGDGILTERIAKKLNLSRRRAETKKKKIGLAENRGKTSRVLARGLEPLVEEIKQGLDYFKKRASQQLSEIVLMGECRIKGLAGYLQTRFDLPARLGVSAALQANESIENVLKKREPSFYLAAVGLALRQLDRKWQLRDPAIVVKEKNKNGDLTSVPFVKSSFKNMSEEIFGKRKLLTAVILGTVLIILGVIFWTGRKAGNQPVGSVGQSVSAPAGEATHYSQSQTFEVKVPVAARNSEYRVERIKGRLIENVISQAADYQEAVVRSRLAVEKDLKTGERLWLEPLPAKDENLPATVRWLVYSQEDAEKLFLAEVDKLNQSKTDYVLDDIEMNVLEETINSGVFYLKGKATVKLNQLFESAEQGERVESSAVEETKIEPTPIQKVIIKETETGWLNVRKGPGTNFPSAVKIYPGEKYELLEDSGNWLKIKVDEDTEGWIFSIYGLKENLDR